MGFTTCVSRSLVSSVSSAVTASKARELRSNEKCEPHKNGFRDACTPPADEIAWFLSGTAVWHPGLVGPDFDASRGSNGGALVDLFPSTVAYHPCDSKDAHNSATSQVSVNGGTARIGGCHKRSFYGSAAEASGKSSDEYVTPWRTFSSSIFNTTYASRFGSEPSYHAAATMAAAVALQSALVTVNVSLNGMSRSDLTDMLSSRMMSLSEPSFFGQIAFNRFGQRFSEVVTVQINNHTSRDAVVDTDSSNSESEHGHCRTSTSSPKVCYAGGGDSNVVSPISISTPIGSANSEFVFPIPQYFERVPFEYKYLAAGASDRIWTNEVLWGSVGCFLAFLCFLLIVFFILHRKNPSLQYASPLFCAFSLFGSMLIFTLPMVWTTYSSPALCKIRWWWLLSSFSLLTAPIAVVTWRIYRVVQSQRKFVRHGEREATNLKWTRLMKLITMILLPPIIGNITLSVLMGNKDSISTWYDPVQRNNPQLDYLCVRLVRYSAKSCQACPTWRQFDFRPRYDYLECQFFGSGGSAFQVISLLSIAWSMMIIFVALFYVVQVSGVKPSEAAQLYKVIDVKPVVFVVYNLVVGMLVLGALLIYPSGCGSEVYMRDQEGTCYFGRFLITAVCAFIAVLTLFARKLLLVTFTVPNIVKRSKRRRGRQNNNGSSAKSPKQSMSPSMDSDDEADGSKDDLPYFICCWCIKIEKDETVYIEEDDGSRSDSTADVSGSFQSNFDDDHARSGQEAASASDSDDDAAVQMTHVNPLSESENGNNSRRRGSSHALE